MEATASPAGPALGGGGASSLDAGAVFLLVATLCAFMLPALLLFPPVPPRRSDALLETHERLGVPDPRRPSPPGQHRPAAGAPAGARLQGLLVYPVKSCRGIEVARSRVLPAGLEFDRLFTFARPGAEGRWEFVTQRQLPLLATVEVEVWLPDAARARLRQARRLKAGARGPHDDDHPGPSRGFVVLRFPWREPGPAGWPAWLAAKLGRGPRARPEGEAVLPLDYPGPDEAAARGYRTEAVRIWRDTVPALNVGADLPPELARYLGAAGGLALFRVDPGRLREVRRCAPRRESAGYQPVTGFQDAYPLHLISLSSMRDFAAKVPKDETLETLDVRRFRANIIVSGADAYDEESWKAIRFKPALAQQQQQLDEASFAVSCRTVRCKMPNVDPDTGVRHPVEPDRSLRRLREVDEGAPRLGCLGMQLTPLFARTERAEDLQSTLVVGMELEVLERGQHVYIKQ